MSYQLPPDIQQLVSAHIASGDYKSQDEVLRDALRALTQEQEDLVAVQDAIAEWKAGDKGTPLREAINDIRRMHGLQSDA